jgi:hypothetical protein
VPAYILPPPPPSSIHGPGRAGSAQPQRAGRSGRGGGRGAAGRGAGAHRPRTSVRRPARLPPPPPSPTICCYGSAACWSVIESRGASAACWSEVESRGLYLTLPRSARQPTPLSNGGEEESSTAVSAIVVACGHAWASLSCAAARREETVPVAHPALPLSALSVPPSRAHPAARRCGPTSAARGAHYSPRRLTRPRARAGSDNGIGETLPARVTAALARITSLSSLDLRSVCRQPRPPAAARAPTRVVLISVRAPGAAAAATGSGRRRAGRPGRRCRSRRWNWTD